MRDQLSDMSNERTGLQFQLKSFLYTVPSAILVFQIRDEFHLAHLFDNAGDEIRAGGVAVGDVIHQGKGVNNG